MTVTREPADRAGPDDELAALEAAAEQARGDARRAAQAVRMARRARGMGAGDTTTEVSAEPGPSLTKPTPKSTPKSEPEPEPATVVAADDTATETDDPTSHSDTDPDIEVPVDETDTEAAPAGRRRPRRVTVLAAVFALLAAVFVVVAAVVHVRAGDDASTSPAAARDAALLAARQDIVVLNTLDYTDVDGGLQRWLGATTGTLRDQLSQVSDSDKQAIAVSKSRTTASVPAAAVTQVDPTKGAATVIASVQIDVTPDGGEATTKRTRFSLTMQREGDTWKIGAVQQVGVTLS